MTNAINLVLANGNKYTVSAALDERVVSVHSDSMVVVAKTAKAAAELQGEAKAWGCTSVLFLGRTEAKKIGY